MHIALLKRHFRVQTLFFQDLQLQLDEANTDEKNDLAATAATYNCD